MPASEHAEDDSALTPEEEHAQNRRAFFSCLGLLIAIAGAVVGVVFLFKTAGCSSQTLLAVELGPAPATYSFATESPGVVQVWANMKFRFKGFSSKVGNDELPHLLDYAIEIEGPQGDIRKLECNPLNSNVFRTSMESPGQIGEDYAHREYDGLIKGCTFAAKAGKHQLRARLVWRERGDDRFDFERTGLILRFAPDES